MKLIDKVILPKKDSKVELHYNPNYCKIEKNVGGSLIIVNDHKEYIKEYVIEDGFMIYDFKGKMFKMPLTKLDYIMTDLVVYKVKYLDFQSGEGNYANMNGKVTYNEALLFFKRDDEITLIEDYDMVTGKISCSQVGRHYHRIATELTIITEYELDYMYDEKGRTLYHESYYIPTIVERYTKELNINALIDKI